MLLCQHREQQRSWTPPDRLELYPSFLGGIRRLPKEKSTCRPHKTVSKMKKRTVINSTTSSKQAREMEVHFQNTMLLFSKRVSELPKLSSEGPVVRKVSYSPWNKICSISQCTFWKSLCRERC